MKLYIANGSYYGTQADARKIDKGFEQIEVPTDKEGLIAYLNEHCVEQDDDEIGNPNIVRSAVSPEAFRELYKDGPTVEGYNVTLTGVEAFIQSAGHPQVASIFENCVYRARELVEAPPAPGSLQEKMAAVASEARDAKGRPSMQVKEVDELIHTEEAGTEPLDEIDPLA